MTRFNRIVITGLIPVGLCGLFVFIAQAQTLATLENSLNELRERVRQLEERSNEYRQTIQEKQSQINNLQNRVVLLNAQIGKLNNDIQLTEARIATVELETIETNNARTKTMQAIERSRRVIGAVIREIDAQDRVSLIELLFSDTRLSEVMMQQRWRQDLHASLGSALSDLKTENSRLTELLEILEDKRQELDGLKTTLSSQRRAARLQRDEQSDVLKTTRGQEAQYRDLLGRVEAERRRIMEDIVKLEEEAKRERAFQLYVKTGAIPAKGTRMFRIPLEGAVVTQGYGMSSYAARGGYGGKIHNGIDYSTGVIGARVSAAASGKVIGKSEEACPNFRNLRCQGGWGNWVAIQHEGGLVTLYGHLMEAPSVSVGETVQVGKLIGFMGSSGNSTGAHLHFSIYNEFFILPQGFPGYNPEGTLNPIDYL